MESADFLFVVAEISVAFAGFAGLVTVVSQRLNQGRSRAQTEAQQLRSLLLSSLTTAFAALLPYVVHHGGLGDSVAWRASSGVFAVTWAVHVGFGLVSVRRLLMRTGAPNPWSLVPGLYWLNHVVHLLVFGALALGAFGVWGRSVPTVYLGSLLACLYVSASLLVSLFLSLVRERAA